MTLRVLPILILLLLSLVSACSTPRSPEITIPAGAKLTLKTIKIQANPLANGGRPLAVDIVYAYSRDALKRLQGYTAKGWFSVKPTNLIDWKGEAEWQEYAIRPGEQRTVNSFPRNNSSPLALVIFARYPGNGLNRFIVVGGSELEVNLEQAGIVVSGK